MATTRINLSKGLLKHKQPTFHFFASNVFEWFITDDLHKAIDTLDRKCLTYWLWYVPGDIDTPYDVQFYQPQVKGSFVLAHAEFHANGRRVK